MIVDITTLNQRLKYLFTLELQRHHYTRVKKANQLLRMVYFTNYPSKILQTFWEGYLGRIFHFHPSESTASRYFNFKQKFQTMKLKLNILFHYNLGKSTSIKIFSFRLGNNGYFYSTTHCNHWATYSISKHLWYAISVKFILLHSKFPINVTSHSPTSKVFN